MRRARRRECRAGGRAFSGRREVMGRAWRQECCARGRVLSRRLEVMGRARRRECRARGCAFSLRGTAGQRPRKPGTRGAAWSSSKACHAEMRHLSRHSPSPRPDGHFPSVAERDTAGLSRGASRGTFPGLYRELFRGLHQGLFRGLHRGFSGGLHRGFSGGFSGGTGGLARGNATSIPNTARRQPDGRSPSVTAPGAARASLKGMPRGDAASISA